MALGLLELGEVLLAASERRLDTISGNVANATTPGYKSLNAFSDFLNAANSDRATVDFAQGGLRATGAPFDLALSGRGFLRVRANEAFFYVRGGQFSRTDDGRLANAQGMMLQGLDGGDVLVAGGNAEILQDGMILEQGVPTARIGVFETQEDAFVDALGGALFSAPEGDMREASETLVRQRMLEASNVDLTSQMVEMMAALRQAEIGARIVQSYDGLLGQAISTLGNAK